MIELRLRIAAGHPAGRRDRRQADARAVRADLGHDGLGHLQHQPGAVFDRAAIGVGALVRAILGELVQQITVGPMDLDPVEARLDGVGRSLAKIVDDARDLVQAQGARGRGLDKSAVHECLGFCRDRRGSHGGRAARLHVDMRHPTHMPQLQEDAPALGMDRIGDLAPSGDLFGRIDAGRVLIALCLRRYLRRLGDDQSRGRALRVIFGRMGSGHQALRGAVAGQRCHDDAVRQAQGAKVIGLKECVLVHRFRFPGVIGLGRSGQVTRSGRNVFRAVKYCLTHGVAASAARAMGG